MAHVFYYSFIAIPAFAIVLLAIVAAGHTDPLCASFGASLLLLGVHVVVGKYKRVLLRQAAYMADEDND